MERTTYALTQAQANAMRREQLIDHASKWSLPLFECSEPDELAAMTLEDIRFDLVEVQQVWDDRLADALSYRD